MTLANFNNEDLGKLGTCRQYAFHGPGLDNTDATIMKNVKLTESKSLQFRAEFFNVFNHASFASSGAIVGDINNGSFGQWTGSVHSARFAQFAAKFMF